MDKISVSYNPTTKKVELEGVKNKEEALKFLEQTKIEVKTGEDEYQEIDPESFDENFTIKDADTTPQTEEIDEEVDLDSFKEEIRNGDKKIKKIVKDFGYKKLFNLLDEDGDGTLSKEELQKLNKKAENLSDVKYKDFKKYIKDYEKSEKDSDDLDELQPSQDLSSLGDYSGATVGGNSIGSSGGISGGGGVNYGGGSYNSGGITSSPVLNGANEKSETEKLDEQIKQLETVDIPNTEKQITETLDNKEKDIKEQEEIQEKAIKESDEIDAKLKEEYEEAENAVKETEEKLTETEKSKVEAESNLNEITSNISALDAQISSIRTDTDDEKVNEQNKATIAKLKSEKEALEQQKTEAENKVKELEKNIEDLEKTLEEQKKAKEEVLEKIKENIDPNSELAKIIEETETKMKEISENSEKDVSTLNNTLKTQQTELSSLKEEKAKKEAEAQNKTTGKIPNGVLKGQLAGKESLVEEICAKYNIDPVFVASVIGLESGYGSTGYSSSNNFMGYRAAGDLGTSSRGFGIFSTPEAGLNAAIKNLAGYTRYGISSIDIAHVDQIGKIYCEGGEWAGKVKRIYNEIQAKA